MYADEIWIYTEELVEGVQDGLPGLSSFFPGHVCKMSRAAVDMQTIDTLQHQVDHSLETHTHTHTCVSYGLFQRRNINFRMNKTI